MSDPAATIDLLKNAVEVVNKTCQGPTPTDALKRPQYEMSGAHALFITGLLSVYEQASSISSSNHQNFVQYALVWLAGLRHHHSFEEEIYFPMFPANFDSQLIFKEHETFQEGISTTEEYLLSCLPIGEKWGIGEVVALSETRKTKDAVSFDGEHLRRILESYAQPLVDHLQAEIGYLEPGTLRACGMTDADVRHMEKVSEAYFMKLPLSTIFTWGVLVSPNEGFPPAPGFLKYLLVPWVFYWFHRSWWQFAPKK